MVWLFAAGGAALFALGLLAAHLFTRATRPSYKADAARLARRDSDRQRSAAALNLEAAEAAAVVLASGDGSVDGAIDFMRALGASKRSSEG